MYKFQIKNSLKDLLNNFESADIKVVTNEYRIHKIKEVIYDEKYNEILIQI